MKKITLQFHSLSELTSFARNLTGGYLLNTNNLTLTGKIPELQIGLAQDMYNAILIETTEKVFSYDAIL